MKKKKLLNLVVNLEHENNLLLQANSNYKKEIFELKANLQDNCEANKYLMGYIKNQKAEISRLKEKYLFQRQN